MNPFILFAIRAVMGVVFAVIVMRIFRPHAGMISIMIVAAILVGLAYVFESFRKRNREPKKRAGH